MIVLQNIFCLVTDPAARCAVQYRSVHHGKPCEQDRSDWNTSRYRQMPVSSTVPAMWLFRALSTPTNHFYQTLTRNIPAVQNVELFDWLVHLYDVWKYLDEEALYYSSLSAMSELLKTGCTLSTDHHYLYPRNFGGDIMAMQFRAAGEVGIRFFPYPGQHVTEQEGWRATS